MEERSKFSSCIDLSSTGALPHVSQLAAILQQQGEFAVALRCGRIYSQRLVPAQEHKDRRMTPIKSAFVAGGTKVRWIRTLYLFQFKS